MSSNVYDREMNVQMCGYANVQIRIMCGFRLLEETLKVARTYFSDLEKYIMQMVKVSISSY